MYNYSACRCVFPCNSLNSHKTLEDNNSCKSNPVGNQTDLPTHVEFYGGVHRVGKDAVNASL